jgi:hypothetical protein
MKIRNGFVSNSSSSSFVVILTKNQYTELLKTIDDYQKAVLDALGHEEAKVCGQDAIIFQGVQGNISSFEDMEIDVDRNLSQKEWSKKYKYERYSQEAFDAIPWPEGTWSGGTDC